MPDAARALSGHPRTGYASVRRLVVESADAIARIIMDAYLSPNMTLQEVRNTWVEQHIDPLRDFSEACREELQILGNF